MNTPREPTAGLNLPSNIAGPDHTAAQQQVILLVEEDTTANAAAQYVPDGWTVLACPTPRSYLGNASQAVIWGRNDEGGRTWAEAVAEAVQVPCHVVTLSKLPRHWHLSDPLPPKRTPQQLTEYLTASLSYCQARLRASASHQPPPPPVSPPATTQTPTQGYILSPRGQMEKLYANVVILLRDNRERWPLSFDEFAHRAFLGAEPLQDSDLREIADWVQHEAVRCGTTVIHEGIIRAAEMTKFHPIKQYLESLTWDGKPRLSRMLSVLAGAAPEDDDGLSDLLGRKWMIQAVARIYEPGCQADAMLVLEGEQGVGKSSLFRALFGDRWFTDHLPDLKDKDAMLQLRGVWCVEISELAALGRADGAKIKQFLTSRVDRYRDPYGRIVADWPRTSVFAGTINPGAEGYLKDPTGGRRFWPVPISGEININGVSENRDQLWAEAVSAYRAGEVWHFTADELARRGKVAERQSARLEEDPWEPAIEDYVASRDTTTTGDILRYALNLTTAADWGRAEQIRVGRILTGLRWSRRKMRVGHKTAWVYYRSAHAAPATEPELPDVDSEMEAR